MLLAAIFLFFKNIKVIGDILGQIRFYYKKIYILIEDFGESTSTFYQNYIENIFLTNALILKLQ